MLKFLCLIILCFCFTPACNSQQYKKFNFSSDIDTLLKIHPNGFAVYFTALWCSPCIGKSKPISDFFATHKTNVGFVFVYDPYKFSTENGERLLKDIFTSNNNYILDDGFYTSKALIQINPQNKAINNIKKSLSILVLKKGNLNKLGFGELLFFNPKKELSILNLAYNANISDSLIQNFLSND